MSITPLRAVHIAPRRAAQALTRMDTRISLPELGLVALTRGMLGAGVALLLGAKADPRTRRAVGWTLTAVGIVTTLPLLLDVLAHRTPRAP